MSAPRLLPRLLVMILLLLSACASEQAVDAPARLAVPPSFSSYLPSGSITAYSQVVAAALRDQGLPAVADYAGRRDWALRLSITQSGATVTPVFNLIDPSGTERLSLRSRPVASDAWRRGRPETMREAATEVAAKIAPMFTKLEAERRQGAERQRLAAQAANQATARAAGQAVVPDRPMRVAIVSILGAPADGNQVLRQLLKEKLTRRGEVVQDGEANADFTIRAKIDDIEVDAKTRRLEIFWLMRNARNQEVGEIIQLEEVATGALDRGWGRLAESVTDEAAGAVHDVIQTQLGRR